MMPADSTVTRETVSAWIDAWNESGKTETLEQWVRRHIKEMRLPESMVNTVGHETLDDWTPFADMVVADLESYPNATTSAAS